ncbi:MAG: hypothetical protein D6735_08970 [Acidobacteria bacterium]|jgi:L-amino acid N-acyltransferase YncA|nr:MAG: hypothetical protein D6735_08970 [Acidobacteriota bacterium]
MQWEFSIVAPYLPTQAVVISDDVRDNLAFANWVAKINPLYYVVVQQADKRTLFGVSVFHKQIFMVHNCY